MIILYSYRLTPTANDENLHLVKEKAEAKAKSQFQMMERMLQDNKVASYNFMVEVGFLSDRIQSHAARNNNSLLIIGSDVARLIQGHDEKGLIPFLDGLQIPTFILPDKKQS